MFWCEKGFHLSAKNMDYDAHGARFSELLTSRATHAHPTSPRSTGFCAIWDCISSSLRAHLRNLGDQFSREREREKRSRKLKSKSKSREAGSNCREPGRTARDMPLTAASSCREPEREPWLTSDDLARSVARWPLRESENRALGKSDLSVV